MPALDTLTPEQYRARHEALLAGARTRAGLEAPPPAKLDAATVLSREPIPGGWYHTVHLRRGQALRLVNTAGTPGISAMLWNARDRTERFSAADTMKVQWTARIRGVRLLLSDMGRVLVAIIADSCGWHDALVGGSTPQSNAQRYGAHDLRNTRDNLLLAAGKHGLDARDVSPCITFFAGVKMGGDGCFHWLDGATKPGDAVDLLAAMDVLVAVSNCPHPLCPAVEYAPQPIEAIVWQPPPGADSLPRHATPEAERAYENTERADAQ